jgi:Flp pilus assembly protein TadB
MRGDRRRPAPTSVGALTRRDRHREAALVNKLDASHRNFSTSTSGRTRRRNHRSVRRTERALNAQRRRPQSVLSALAFVLVVLIAATVMLRASSTLALILAAVLAVDVGVLRRRRRIVRRA